MSRALGDLALVEPVRNLRSQFPKVHLQLFAQWSKTLLEKLSSKLAVPHAKAEHEPFFLFRWHCRLAPQYKASNVVGMCVHMLAISCNAASQRFTISGEEEHQ